MFVLEVMLHRQLVYLLLVVTSDLATLPLLYPIPILVSSRLVMKLSHTRISILDLLIGLLILLDIMRVQ